MAILRESQETFNRLIEEEPDREQKRNQAIKAAAALKHFRSAVSKVAKMRTAVGAMAHPPVAEPEPQPDTDQPFQSALGPLDSRGKLPWMEGYEIVFNKDNPDANDLATMINAKRIAEFGEPGESSDEQQAAQLDDPERARYMTAIIEDLKTVQNDDQLDQLKGDYGTFLDTL